MLPPSGYEGCTALAGPVVAVPPGPARVRYRPALDGRERRVLGALVAVHIAVTAAFLGWLCVFARVGGGAASQLALACVVVVEVVRAGQSAALWVFGLAAQDPVPLAPPAGLRVALLTTVVPDREPLTVLTRTLVAMRRVAADGPVDVWVLDEGDDPGVRRTAAALGVHHFTRRGVPARNTAAGPYRAGSKAGNHNAWRAEHEMAYDIVAQVDPDHVPRPELLARTLGYFRDPDVAYVVAPQVYGNRAAGFVPHGAAAQSYLFTGVVQRGGNGLGAPLLIGTNHLYRVTAWRQVGGYQDSVTEDHLTGMTVLASERAPNRPWRGVYTPDVLAVGEGPTTWSDYFRQQRRWCFGVCGILLHDSLPLMCRLRPGQRVAFALMQVFYPSAALAWLAGNTATGIWLLAGPPVTSRQGALWLGLWAASGACWLTLFLWLRRLDLAGHERRELGLRGLALSAMTGPVYLGAALAALLGRPLAYQVTGKGRCATRDTWRTFRGHLASLVGALGVLAVGIGRGHVTPALLVWALLSVTACAAPPLAAASHRRRVQDRRARACPVPCSPPS